MAWITPVTDRTSGAYMTLSDMNRIVGNIDYLTTELTEYGLYTGASLQKTSYTHNDYITVADWNDVLYVLERLSDQTAVEVGAQADTSTTYENMNAVESITLAIYELFQMLLAQENLNHYAGDDIYPQGSISIYAGGLAV